MTNTARDALLKAAGDALMTPSEWLGARHGIHHALNNPALVLAALVEAHGLDACLEALGGSYDSTELDDGADTDDEVWVAFWSFPTKETTDE